MKKIVLFVLFLGLVFAFGRSKWPKVQGEITKASVVTTTQSERSDKGWSFHLENSIDVGARASVDLGPGKKARRSTASQGNSAVADPQGGKVMGATERGLRSRVTAVNLRMEPDHYAGPCPGQIALVAEISADGPGSVWYSFQAGAVSNSPEGTLTFSEAGTKTVRIDGRFNATPAVPEAAVIAAMEEEDGNHGPLTVSSGPVKYNITCTPSR